MVAEENVCEETTLTEQVNGIGSSGENKVDRVEKEGSTVAGKFKDVDALVRAYSSLQAEFTRRSQRLKELENEVENFRLEKAVAESGGVEKLRKNAEAKRAEKKKFDEFLTDVNGKKQKGVAVESAEENDGKPMEENATAEDFAATEKASEETSVCEERADEATETEADAGIGKTIANAVGEKNEAARETVKPVAEKTVELSSEELYDRAVGNETVRLKIIGEYLATVGRAGAPLTVGNAGAMASAPKKPNGISGAGEIALRYLKKQRLID